MHLKLLCINQKMPETFYFFHFLHCFCPCNAIFLHESYIAFNWGKLKFSLLKILLFGKGFSVGIYVNFYYTVVTLFTYDKWHIFVLYICVVCKKKFDIIMIDKVT